MFCARCGGRLPEAAQFCPACGSQITSFASAVAPVTPETKTPENAAGALLVATCSMVAFGLIGNLLLPPLRGLPMNLFPGFMINASLALAALAGYESLKKGQVLTARRISLVTCFVLWLYAMVGLLIHPGIHDPDWIWFLWMSGTASLLGYVFAKLGGNVWWPFGTGQLW